MCVELVFEIADRGWVGLSGPVESTLHSLRAVPCTRSGHIDKKRAGEATVVAVLRSGACEQGPREGERDSKVGEDRKDAIGDAVMGSWLCEGGGDLNLAMAGASGLALSLSGSPSRRDWRIRHAVVLTSRLTAVQTAPGNRLRLLETI